ncbi:hypothetical protein RhiirA4_490230 [Rhizophagus irregularis]|uniref:Uncharacterized protein n=1 Tax=Rhizophagus irregularis TaxID=588596 RepID=A0A2I1HVG1_9GLOM|nr:hypothetical protein RhiirA4_490230 [Rhizophagus irregularis]
MGGKYNMHNYHKPKKWYKELQNIVTVDDKTFKSEYRMPAVFYLIKGYNMTQCKVNRNNIPKKLTFIGPPENAYICKVPRYLANIEKFYDVRIL